MTGIESDSWRLYIERLDGAGRQAESDAVSRIVEGVFGSVARLLHTPAGAPYIDGYMGHISISHGAGFAVMAVANTPIGVDIEAPRAQLKRVKGKFIRQDDRARSLLHAWTAKEATFKAAGIAGLTIVDIAVRTATASIPEHPDAPLFHLSFYKLGTALIAISRPKYKSNRSN